MNTIYSTERLDLKIINPGYEDLVLDFYQKNKQYLEPVEPKRVSNFYTPAYQRSNLVYEYDAFIKSDLVRLWLLPKGNPHELLGSICFSNFQRGAFCRCMVGYKLDFAAYHQGYMTEALSFIIPIIMKEYGMRRIEALVLPDNQPSISLLNNLGFKQEGLLHSVAQICGVPRDHLLFAYTSPLI